MRRPGLDLQRARWRSRAARTGGGCGGRRGSVTNLSLVVVAAGGAAVADPGPAVVEAARATALAASGAGERGGRGLER